MNELIHDRYFLETNQTKNRLLIKMEYDITDFYIVLYYSVN